MISKRGAHNSSHDGEHVLALARAIESVSAKRKAWPVMVAIAAAAAGVRLYRLDHRSFWLDEILDVFTLRYSWSGMWRGLQRVVYNPPLDYFIRKLLELANPSDAERRVVGVAWGTACVVVLGILIARRSDRRVGLLAATFLAFAPYHVRYSQEVRPYALALFLICSSLLLLDLSLERPTPARVGGFILTSVATAYTLYLAALVVFVSASTLLIEDALAENLERRRSARRLLRWSPLLVAAVAAGYGPWWRTLVTAVKAPPFTQPPPLEWSRIGRVASYFAFASIDWHPLGLGGALFVALVLAGSILAILHFRLAFLVVWGFGGLLLTEILEHQHSVYDSVFHYLPAGIALTGLAAVPVGWLFSQRKVAALGLVVGAAVVALDLRGLVHYFDHGRPDWRPVAAFLRGTPPAEPILVGNQYTQLCLAYYVVGPDWLCCRAPNARLITVVDPSKAATRREPGPAWLVLDGAGQAEKLLGSANPTRVLRFSDAEGDGGVQVIRLSGADP